MRKTFFYGIVMLLMLAVSASISFAQNKESNIISLPSRGGYGVGLIPLSDNAVRVQVVPSGCTPLTDIVYLSGGEAPSCNVEQDSDFVALALKNISVRYDKRNDVLTFYNKFGKVLLAEKVGGRSLQKSSVQGEPTYVVSQQFNSPYDEYLFGTGQFQDGYLNIKGLTRRLTQVNTQISLPFVLSNYGYGLLWNNYGLTDFNPAKDFVRLTRKDEGGQEVTVDVTSTEGNKRETRNMNSFTAEFSVDKAADYSLMLDVGQTMARKYNIAVDGKKLVDFSNLWLPPTTSLIVRLDKGTHTVEVEGERNDSPVLYWRKVVGETEFRSPVANALDYTVFAGNADEVIASYRKLTGEAPMIPLWALGYVHCRERYHSQAELLENAQEFRRRQIPIDMIVQDWQYWGKYGWNAMRFDEDNYPDPATMVKDLHEMDIRFMLSVWSKIDKNSEVGKQALDKGMYIDGTDWIDFFNPHAAEFYWDNFSNRLLKPYKIDAWWQDATEPENDDLLNRKVNNGTTLGEIYRNAYPLFVNKTVYEGLRKDDPNRRAMIFTRCAFTGQQRYGAVTWSGDVGHDWETLRRQIAAGLGQMSAGMPWWTYDAGGFFRPHDQYTNKDYHEQLVRWVQTSTFLPLMRIHGYMSDTEPWRYGEDVENSIRKYINLRYSLIPYIYSKAADVTFAGSTLMRPLVMDFADDKEALKQECQFMFGNSLLVAPVIKPSVSKWKVYLPKGTEWVDFWDGTTHSGGEYVDVAVDKDKIPLFVKAGSIVPMAWGKQHTSQKADEPLEIRIYVGGDATFTLYEDEGDNYNYESGKFSKITFRWDDIRNQLTIDERKGEYDGMQETREFLISFVSKENGVGDAPSVKTIPVKYSGKRKVFKAS